jgi:hypothetical protein
MTESCPRSTERQIAQLLQSLFPGEVYFHANALQGLMFKALDDGTEVLFGLEQGDKGPQATVVTLPPPVAKVV